VVFGTSLPPRSTVAVYATRKSSRAELVAVLLSLLAMLPWLSAVTTANGRWATAERASVTWYMSADGSPLQCTSNPVDVTALHVQAHSVSDGAAGEDGIIAITTTSITSCSLTCAIAQTHLQKPHAESVYFLTFFFGQKLNIVFQFRRNLIFLQPSLQLHRA
jgi:hypothetical protein